MSNMCLMHERAVYDATSGRKFLRMLCKNFGAGCSAQFTDLN